MGKVLEQPSFPFGVVRTPKEAQSAPQARVNGFVEDLPLDVGVTLPVTLAPAQFDGVAPCPTPAVGHAAETDEILRHPGYSPEEIVDLKLGGAARRIGPPRRGVS